MALYKTNEKMINTGIYQIGNNPEIDLAIQKHAEIEEFLKQEEFDPCPINDTLLKLSELSGVVIPEEEFSDKPGAPLRPEPEIIFWSSLQ